MKPVAILLCLTIFSAAEANIPAKVTVKLTGAAFCDPSSATTMRIPVEIQIVNESDKGITIGRVDIFQERYLGIDEKGQFRVLVTSAPPEEVFDAPASVGGPSQLDSRVHETTLPAKATKTVPLLHYIFWYANYEQVVGNERKLFLSFHVSNLERSGHATDWWSDPVTIVVPPTCRIK